MPGTGRAVKSRTAQLRGFQPRCQPACKVFVGSAHPSSTPSLEPFKDSVAKKRKQAFKNKKRDISRAPQVLPGSPHLRRKSPKHKERSFKGWITALGVEGPPGLPFCSVSAASTPQPRPPRGPSTRHRLRFASCIGSAGLRSENLRSEYQ